MPCLGQRRDRRACDRARLCPLSGVSPVRPALLEHGAGESSGPYREATVSHILHEPPQKSSSAHILSVNLSRSLLA